MGRRNQQHLDQTGPAARYNSRTDACADNDQADNTGRHGLDARNTWAVGTANYGQTRTNLSYRHGSIPS